MSVALRFNSCKWPKPARSSCLNTARCIFICFVLTFCTMSKPGFTLLRKKSNSGNSYFYPSHYILFYNVSIRVALNKHFFFLNTIFSEHFSFTKKTVKFRCEATENYPASAETAPGYLGSMFLPSITPLYHSCGLEPKHGGRGKWHHG